MRSSSGLFLKYMFLMIMKTMVMRSKKAHADEDPEYNGVGLPEGSLFLYLWVDSS
jgi:hypothetical protein